MGWFRRAKNYVGVFLFGVKIATDWQEALEAVAEYSAAQEKRLRSHEETLQAKIRELENRLLLAKDFATGLESGADSLREQILEYRNEVRAHRGIVRTALIGQRQAIASYLNREVHGSALEEIIDNIEKGKFE